MGVLSLFTTRKDDDFGLTSTILKNIYRHKSQINPVKETFIYFFLLGVLFLCLINF